VWVRGNLSLFVDQNKNTRAVLCNTWPNHNQDRKGKSNGISKPIST